MRVRETAAVARNHRAHVARAGAPGHAAWRHGLHGAALSRRDSHDAAIPKKAGATPALQRLHP